MLYTTKRLLRKHGACAPSYRKFFRVHRKYAEDDPIPLTVILETNGLDDALWCLKATTEPSERFVRELACDFAEHLLPIWEAAYPDDKRPKEAIEVTRRFARGEATQADLSAARSAAQDAYAWATPHAARVVADIAVNAAIVEVFGSFGTAERERQAQHLREALEASAG